MEPIQPAMPRSNSCPEKKTQKVESPKKLFPLLRWNSKIKSEEKKPDVEKNKKANDGNILRFPSLPLTLAYASLPYAKDNLTEMAINNQWRRKFRCATATLPLTVQRKDILLFFDGCTRTMNGNSCLPFSPSQINPNTVTQFGKTEHLDQVFLTPLRMEFLESRSQFETILTSSHMRTKESDNFYRAVNAMIRQGDYETFMANFRKMAFSDKSSFITLAKYFHFGNEVFENVDDAYNRFISAANSIMDQIKTVYHYTPLLLGKASRWKEDFDTKTFSTISRYELARCVEVEKKVMLSDLKINHLQPEVKNGFYLTGVIHLINSVGFDPTATLESASNDRDVLVKKEQAIPCEDILKLCSAMCWAQADNIIRRKVKTILFASPYMSKCEVEGVKCRVYIKSPNHYRVTQSKTYATYRRMNPDDKDWFFADGPPIGWTTYKWKVSRSLSNGLKSRLKLKGWKVNEAAAIEDQLQFLLMVIEHLRPGGEGKVAKV